MEQSRFLIINRKLIVPQKEPSPLLDRKIEELEAKFADMTDEELEDLGDDDGELGDQSLPLMQSAMSGDMDMMSYPPPQVSSLRRAVWELSRRLIVDDVPLVLFAVRAQIHQRPVEEGGLEAQDQHERLHPLQQRDASRHQSPAPRLLLRRAESPRRNRVEEPGELQESRIRR